MRRNLATYQLMAGKSALNELADVPVTGEAVEIMQTYVVFGPGTSAGAVTIEESHSQSYTGTWATVVGPIAWTTSADRVIANSLVNGFVRRRARISTAIVGGTVDVYVTLAG